MKFAAKGQSIIEALTAAFIFIPILLLTIDLVVIAVGNQANQRLADNAARAAANQHDSGQALVAAQEAVNRSNVPGVVTSRKLRDMSYDESIGQVTVTTYVDIHLPAPFPGWENVTLTSKALQPIVATPAPI